MIRLLRWPARQLRSRTLLVLVLLLVALGYVASGLAGVVRELDAPLMLTVAVLGLLAGWILAMTPLRGWIAWVVASTVGLLGVFLRVGRLDEKLVGLLQALGSLGGEFFRWLASAGDTSSLRQGPSLNWEPITAILEELQAGGGALLARVRDWGVALAAGEPAFDPAAAALMWSLVLWAVSAWAGWTARRRARPLQAVTPAGVLLLATFYYEGETTTLLPVVLGVGLLLMALLRRDARVRRWQAAGIAPVENGRRTARIVIAMALALAIGAAAVPSISIEQIVELVQSRDKERGTVDDLAESLGVERPPEPVPEEIAVLEELRAPNLSRRHLINSSPELSFMRAMVIKTDDPLPIIESHELLEMTERGELPSVPRYYWRSRTYDLYVYYGWYTGDTEVIEYRAGEPAIMRADTARAPVPVSATVGLTLPQRTVRQEVRVVGDLQGLIHTAGTLVSVDQDYNVAWHAPGDAFAATTKEKAYNAVSILPVFTVEQLQAAGTDYPDWVRGRYLWLPDTIPERVLTLARDLTATAPTPYDRAYAIETYLRTFPYNLDVPAPPSDRDVADYFLFELQEGYCDYYATAMVVMARAAGLPARYVAGYATGTYDYIKGHYVVAEANAHAWVEVYFPGYGWVEFEPTAGLPAIERPTEGDIVPPEPPPKPSKPEEQVVARPWWNVATWPWWLTGMAGLIVLTMVGVAWVAVDTWRLRRLRPTATAMTLYGRMRRQARRLAVPIRVSDTPNEFAAAFAAWVTNLSQETYRDEWLAPTLQYARCLVACYVQAIYTSQLLSSRDQRQAIRVWQKLGWRLCVAQMRQIRLFGRRLFG
ncbi:MAG: transglutaminase domain-containing protein [Anaerolineae bacterium]|nr:transglutaminase domain-containing protein [Anaerolineae bacterium]